MKLIKLSGRERALLRAIDFANGTSGEELLKITNFVPEDFVDVMNGLISVGYAEVVPYAEFTTIEACRGAMFEVNPSYALELRTALRR